VTAATKTVYRSLSSKQTIFVLVCRELWEFAGDGERYTEKICHGFLPELFDRWKQAGANHIVSIILTSRVHYDESEAKFAAGPLCYDEEGKRYKDFYKVITDMEVIRDSKDTLMRLKNSIWDFKQNILLDHHQNRTSMDSADGPSERGRLIGRLSFAHDGPILEAVNLALIPTETHYVDRSLSLTGLATIFITPGTGYFRVSKQLLRLTNDRMLCQGFGLDVWCLTKSPLHETPIFSFQGVEPELKTERDGKSNPLARDPLWGGDDDPKDPSAREKTTFWWEPIWSCVSFWDRQMDLPLREDR
jgi:DEP domain-containing protein 5